MNLESLTEGFNPQQKAAVEYCDGPALVIAGAGSGKTRVLTYKIAYLIAKYNMEPWSILALTFTNKAANEMKERIAQIIGADRARYLWMGTFHSIFLRILRAEHEAIGFSANFTIYDSSDSKSLVKSIVKEMKLDDKVYKTSTVLGRISNAKNRLVGPQAYAASQENRRADMISRLDRLSDIYTRYFNRCRQADAMDFDDILVYTYLLFRNHPEIRQHYAERFRYVLVDEYQDTNYAQHCIVQQLTEAQPHVCVVGDDAQSIYSFRGANINNILSFNQIYPGSRLFKLEQNYRSTQNIVNAANSLIKKNTGQIFKNVFSENNEGERLSVREAYSDVEEAEIVLNNIRTLRRGEGLEYSDFAILYRTNAQSRVFEENLRKNGVPYRIYGGLSFYQRKEIKDVIAYFRLSVNPNDEEAFKRVINYPARGIGSTTLAKITAAANIQNVSLWTVLGNPLNYGVDVNRGTAAKLIAFRDLVAQFIEKAAQTDAEQAGTYIVKHCGIIADIYADRTPENLSRQENVQELLNGLQEFVRSRIEEGNTNISLSDYLSDVSLQSEVDTDDSDDEHKVTLMTIHSAKGLEFNTVFVVGLEENLFPCQSASENPGEMEEERRLCYVAITRAKCHCFLTYAKSRFRYGKMEFGSPSRFLRDIDPRYLNIQGSSRRSLGSSSDVDVPWGHTRTQGFSSSQQPFARQSVVQRPSARQLSVSASSAPSARPQSSTMRPLTRIVQRPASATSSSTTASVPSGLAVGNRIEHDRFGLGTVERIEGTGDNCKAFVQFDNAGSKQLLLKFARFRVVE